MLAQNILIVKNSTLEIYSEAQCRAEIFDNKFSILPNELIQQTLTPYKFTLVEIPEKPIITDYQELKLKGPLKRNSKIIVEWEIVSKTINNVLKDQYIEKLRIVFERHLQSIKNTYPESEVDGWDLQKEEARNYLLNPNYPTPCLDALAFNRGINKDLLVQKVIAKANEFAIVYGTIIGTRQRIEDQILAANTPNELPIIQDNYEFNFH